jgi:methionyl-tRNA formyltransferase
MIEEIDAGPIYGQRGPISLAGTKEDILNRFIEPCQSLVQWIVETNPTPKPQVGEVVRFSRLPEAQYNALWRTR